MATKLQLITAISESTTRAAVKNPANWTAFLKTAVHNYKYPFQDQLLIYAQRPDATACAEIELWNKLGRWVNRGARGIALIDDNGSRLTLRHVFDLSDTNSRQNRTITLWEMQDRYDEAVTETLKNTFGELDGKADLPSALISAAQNAVDDNFSDYLSELMDYRENSFLEELDELNVEVIFKNILKASVAYMALVRCGYVADEYLTFEDFQDIVNFNTLDTISRLGAATSDISEMLLGEIGSTVKELQKAEKKQSHIFAKSENMRHNVSVKQNSDSERNGEYGTDLHAAGRLPASRSGSTGGTDGYRQIWDVAQNIPEKPQERDVRQPDAVRQAGHPSVGDRPDREGTGEEHRGEAPDEQPRTGQSDRPDGLDGTHERPEASSEGNGTDGVGLQLAWYDRRTEDKSLPFFHADVTIKEILHSIPHLKATKQEIADFYADHEDQEERIAYIKGIFNNEYTELLINGDHRVGYKTYQNVLHLWEGSYTARTSQSYYDWGVIANYYNSMLLFNELLDEPALPSEKQQITLIEQAESEKSSTFSMPQEAIDAILRQGSGIQDGKYRIYLQFQKNASAQRNADFLKNEYGIGGHAPALTGTDIDEWHDSKGIKLTSERYIGLDASILMPWAKVQKRIGELIAADRYLNGREKEHMPVYQQEEEERHQQLAEEAYAREILNREPTPPEQKPISRENAHYTSPIVIKAIYTCLTNMGFQTGNILEPACGIGNFFGLVPESMAKSKLYGVELDSITGRIAKQLYQQANIAVQGFEETNLPDSFFDLAIGNVPFGSYGVADKKYDKHKFLIHDYFFAKSLDKVRPGGIIAFVTSKGTMDKQSPEVRKYIAQRAELLGAVRLPNNAFLANAGTEVTADIIFLQKRDRVIDIEPDWVHLTTTEDGIPINQYFADNPDMVLGTMAFDERMYGNRSETTCIPYEDTDLTELLREAMENIHAEITEYELDELSDDEDTSIPADPSVRNFSYIVVDDKIYYRENSRMNPVETSVTAAGRIKGMIALRDCVRDLIEYQTEDYSDEAIKEQQRKLNRLYDDFTVKYGLINSRGNNMAFADDSSYCLLCSLEVLDEEGELERKADMFTKRTIRQRTTVTHVDTATEALAISIAEKACVDMGFMHSLTGLSGDQLAADLQGVIFRNPEKLDSENKPIFETADAYLSGNVREKLKTARQFAEMRPDIYSMNVTALEAVQPKDLDASEIDVRLGATWLPPDVIKDFVFELLEMPYMYRRYIDVYYSNYTANWNIKGKSDDRSDNIKANVTYGTNRINAYKIIEDTLNLRDVRIFDTVYEDGNEKRILNKKETAIAQQKQEAIKEAFQGWIWKDPKRRERLTRIYNDLYNSNRPREYDGSHIKFTGMNPEITLRKHQVDAVAHGIYGGNTLLAHCVGAGKTYEMAAIAMESKHLGLCNKSMFAVPNHLTEQWAGEFLQLYPSANILVATKKDFETKNRKKFCARIATGDYDAVIIGHSQFEKIPISIERQRRLLQEQISEITGGI